MVWQVPRIGSVVVACVVACGGGDDGGPGGSGDGGGSAIDARVDMFQMCHVDCFGGAQCDNGELELWGYAPRDIDCDQWAPPDYCVAQRQTCPLGCRAEDVYVQMADSTNSYAQYEWLCLPAQPATTATACTTDDQCRPTFAIPQLGGTVTQTYLRCGGAGSCIETTAPVFAGYGGGCTPGGQPTSDFKWIEGANAGEACLYGQRVTSTCVSTFLSRTCTGDWDCPAGSRCNDSIPHADGTRTTSVCTRGTSMRVNDFGC